MVYGDPTSLYNPFTATMTPVNQSYTQNVPRPSTTTGAITGSRTPTPITTTTTGTTIPRPSQIKQPTTTTGTTIPGQTTSQLVTREPEPTTPRGQFTKALIETPGSLLIGSVAVPGTIAAVALSKDRVKAAKQSFIDPGLELGGGIYKRDPKALGTAAGIVITAGLAPIATRWAAPKPAELQFRSVVDATSDPKLQKARTATITKFENEMIRSGTESLIATKGGRSASAGVTIDEYYNSRALVGRGVEYGNMGKTSLVASETGIVSPAKGFWSQMKGIFSGTKATEFSMTKEVSPGTYGTKGLLAYDKYLIKVSGVTKVRSVLDGGFGTGGGTKTSLGFDPVTNLDLGSLPPSQTFVPTFIKPATKSTSISAPKTATTPKNVFTGNAFLPKTGGQSSARTFTGTFQGPSVQESIRIDTGLMSPLTSSMSTSQKLRPSLRSVIDVGQTRNIDKRVEILRTPSLKLDIGEELLQTPIRKPRLGQPQMTEMKLRTPEVPETVLRPPTTITRLVPPTTIITPPPSFISKPSLDVGGFGFQRPGRARRGKRSYRYTPTVYGLTTGRRTSYTPKDVGIQSLGIRLPGGAKPKKKSRRKSIRKSLNMFEKEMNFRVKNVLRL